MVESNGGSGREPRAESRTEPPRRLDLSLTQLLASGLAGATGAIISSYLGVAGTIVGAALFSVVATVGSQVYSHSLRRTRSRIVQSVSQRQISPRRTAITAVVVLFCVIVGLTLFELVLKEPISAWVRGKKDDGTTISKVVHHKRSKAAPAPTPADTTTPSVPITPIPTDTATPPGSTSPTVSATPTPLGTSPTATTPTATTAPTPTP